MVFDKPRKIETLTHTNLLYLAAGYRPHVRAFPSVISRKNIQHNCAEWISM